MATYAISIEFILNAKTDEKAAELGERISAYVLQEKMAKEAHVIDIENRDDDEAIDALDFDEDNE